MVGEIFQTYEITFVDHALLATMVCRGRGVYQIWTSKVGGLSNLDNPGQRGEGSENGQFLVDVICL